MPKVTFTARWVTAVQLPAVTQVDYFDSKPPSLGLRVTPHGRKSWFVMYRSSGRLRGDGPPPGLQIDIVPAQQTKNGLAHRVPLSPPALALLQAMQATSHGSPWVFPSPTRHQQPLGKLQTVAQRLVAVSGIAFVPHDLRRTAASHMTSRGIPRFVVAKILNHVEPGVTKVYDRHSYDAEKHQALDAWGARSWPW